MIQVTIFGKAHKAPENTFQKKSSIWLMSGTQIINLS